MTSISDSVTAADEVIATELRPKTPYLFLCDIIALTKPGIMILLLVSTLCPMVLAANGVFDLAALSWGAIAGALCSGSASMLNCVWDRDIDALMNRTKDRPLVQGRVPVWFAVTLAIIFGIAGTTIWWLRFNASAALMALFGHFFYVGIYTMWLKRSTPQNIVIGGAAGAIPPIVGWVAVTGEINLTAMLLFLVIFLWTPPHFWALALNKNTDYQRANIPMLPVVSGAETTYRQMWWYTFSLLPMSIFLVLSNPSLGWLSFFSFSILGGIFLFKVTQLKMTPISMGEERTRRAWSVFGYSLAYLAIYFVTLVVDSALI